MPAYSFHKRFIPYIEDGSKPHTIRNRSFGNADNPRSNPKKPPLPGDTLYLYTGLRTKSCRKIREEICSDSKSLSISDEFGIVIYERLLTAEELAVAVHSPMHPDLPGAKQLSHVERCTLAWKDGFRDDSPASEQSFTLMRRYWKENYCLPWAGDIYYWKPANEIPCNQ